ncbi:Unsaturated chondroitin disaccharide hydrolase [Paenibacillus sp. P1XP2]|nr:Unsaturated chondroitin disaccharide hydrolase [Paenibacillus sp. P1XP2]
MVGTESRPEWLEEAWSKALDKTRLNASRIGAAFPHASHGGQYTREQPYWWTAGFWPGLLWLMYNDCGDAKFKEICETCEDRLDEVLDGFARLDHDLGFMWTLTSVASHKLTGKEISKIRALKAANYLAARFNLKGRFIRAWNPWFEGEDNRGWAIIDCAMNMPLLFWASHATGDPRYKHIAEAHMDTVLEHFIRPDGSIYHIVRFDPDTGVFVEGVGGQGYDADSAWSRGNAWAIYGLALAYHHTGKTAYLHAAQKAAQFFLASCRRTTCRTGISARLRKRRRQGILPPVPARPAGCCCSPGCRGRRRRPSTGSRRSGCWSRSTGITAHGMIRRKKG